MAGDWLKVETTTPDKPEVFEIAARLKITVPEAFGRLFMVWRWFDQHTEDGNAPIVTLAYLDHVAGVTGFAEAMQNVGWMVGGAGSSAGVSLPNFGNHNGQTAKSRALTARRVATHKKRSGNATGNAKVTLSALPREEKRREEVKERAGATQTNPNPSSFAPTTATREWAEKRGLAITWDGHLDYFRDYLAQGKRYKNLDAAFRNCLQSDWGNLRKQLGVRTVHQNITPPTPPSCAHCHKPITGGFTKMDVGKVCAPCHKGYMEGKWT